MGEPKGYLKVRFVDYVNPGKQDYDGGCCEPATVLWKCDDCDTYFEICLQRNDGAVAGGKCIKFVKTRVRHSDKFHFSRDGSDFGVNGERNPLEYQFDDSWQVSARLRKFQRSFHT